MDLEMSDGRKEDSMKARFTIAEHLLKPKLLLVIFIIASPISAIVLRNIACVSVNTILLCEYSFKIKTFVDLMLILM